ncbi:MAG: hypothetical protein KAJ19_21880 [Gammaproteobacteria bacterium]|nr:hypothetical protein [Gammaproteobacteria bacterium]
MTFYHQNQSWYCHRCRAYSPAQMHTAPQQMHHATTQPLPDEQVARSKVYGAMKMRDTTDEIVPTQWAIAILVLQIFVPIITVYLLFWGINFNLSVSASILMVLGIFLTVVVMVIVQSILVFKLVKRRDEHFRRDGFMRQGMIEYLDAMSIKEKKDINVERWTMNSMHYSVIETDRGASIWALMVGLISIIPILGTFLLLYCLYFLTTDTHIHDKRQRDFNYQFQMSMYKLGKISSISYDWYPLPKRDTSIYIILTIFTLGFALPYWWYANIVDMNTHFNNQWQFESQIIRMIKEEVPDEVPAKP